MIIYTLFLFVNSLDGTYAVHYFDGDYEEHVRVSDIRFPKLQLNDTIEGNWKNSGEWYIGKVAAINGNGTFKIVYGDGDEEYNVTRKLIRPPSLPLPCDTLKSKVSPIRSSSRNIGEKTSPSVGTVIARPSKKRKRVEENEDGAGSMDAKNAARTLFRGLSFVLTGVEDLLWLGSLIKEYGGESFYNSTFIVICLKLNCMQILGVLVDDILTCPLFNAPSESVVFISKPAVYRTEKHFLSIVLNVPMLHHSWVSECCNRNSFVDWKPYMLPKCFDPVEKKAIFYDAEAFLARKYIPTPKNTLKKSKNLNIMNKSFNLSKFSFVY
jgi:hypothetical protein